MTVVPNPAVKGSLQLYFSNEPAGIYRLRIVGPNGEIIYTGRTNFAGGNGFVRISDNGLLNGLYQVEIIKPGEDKEIMKVLY